MSDPGVSETAPARSLSRTVMRDGTYYALAGLISNGVSFFLFPLFAHAFAPREYGVLDLLAVVMTIVNLTVALEINQGLGRHFGEARGHDARVGYAGTAFTFALCCYTVAGAIAFTFAVPLGHVLLGDDVDTSIMRLGVAMMFASGIAYLVTDLLRWRLRPKAYAAVAVATTLTITGGSALLVLVFDLGVEGAVIAQLTGFGVGAVAGIWLSRDVIGLRIDRTRLREMLHFSIPLVPASIGVFLNAYADRLAIKAQLGLSEVGLYGAGFRLSLIVSLTLLGFQGALLPQVLARKDHPDTPAELARVFRLFCGVALVVLVAMSAFADELLRILTPPEYYSAANVVPLLVGAAFFAGMYIFAPGLHLAKRTRQFASITVVAGLANLALAFALAKPLGIEGVALGFLVTAAAGFTVTMIASQRHFPAPHDWRRLLPVAVAGMVLAAASVAAPPTEDHLWALPVKLLACALAVLLASRLTDADERTLVRGLLRDRLRPSRAQ